MYFRIDAYQSKLISNLRQATYNIHMSALKVYIFAVMFLRVLHNTDKSSQLSEPTLHALYKQAGAPHQRSWQPPEHTGSPEGLKNLHKIRNSLQADMVWYIYHAR